MTQRMTNVKVVLSEGHIVKSQSKDSIADIVKQLTDAVDNGQTIAIAIPGSNGLVLVPPHAIVYIEVTEVK